MSAVDEEGPKQEIIIVRRPRHDEDDGHHGGVWKIAFADFMTAMMCFFLVMWLINAANEETRAALASYFNPVKLIDRNSSRKGLDELGGPQSLESTPENQKDTSDSESLTSPSGPSPQSAPSPSDQKSDAGPRSDEHLFSDPYAVLAEIAAETGTLQNTSAKGDGGARDAGPASGASGGESYRDPFAPDFWSQQVDVPEPAATAEVEALSAEAVLEKLGLEGDQQEQAKAQQESAAARPPAEPEIPAQDVAAEETPAAQQEVDPAERVGTDGIEAIPAKEMAEESQAETTAPEAPVKAETPTEAEQAADVPPGAAETAAAQAAAEAEQKAAETRREAEAIREQLTELAGKDGELAEGLAVTATEDGVMISITDEIDSGMFEIGSAVPRRDLVLAMEKIGQVLAERQGRVTINGHTDGRPFKSETYDNWRLSTARAHSAYFMLVRGGLDEQRIVEVAGFADRKLKIPEDPFADANRRIEILLETGG